MVCFHEKQILFHSLYRPFIIEHVSVATPQKERISNMSFDGFALPGQTSALAYSSIICRLCFLVCSIFLLLPRNFRMSQMFLKSTLSGSCHDPIGWVFLFACDVFGVFALSCLRNLRQLPAEDSDSGED